MKQRICKTLEVKTERTIDKSIIIAEDLIAMCQPLIDWMADLNMKAKSIGRRKKKYLHDHELSKVFAERILKIMTEEKL